MKPLRAGDLALEPLEARHAEAMFAVLNDAELHRHLDYPPPPSVEHLRNVYTRLEGRRSPDGAERWLNWIVSLAGAPIGFVQATVMQDGSAWVAYVFAREHHGRGFATRATGAMLDHLVAEHGARAFLASVEAANAPSIRLLARLGFRLATDGESRAHELTPSERLYVRYPSSP